MPDQNPGTSAPTDTPPPINLEGLRVRTIQQAQSELPQPKITSPWEEEPKLPSSDRLSKAYDAAKSWLGEHEQHLSEKYLAPFRTGIDRISEDLQQAGESGHTQTGGRLTEPTRALVSGVGSLLKQVPVGRNVKETALALATPPELGPEGKALNAGEKAVQKVESKINLEGLRVREVPEAPDLSGLRIREVESARVAKELPAQPKLPDTGTHAALKTDDGSIYFDDAPEKQRTHIMLAKDLGIPPERVASGGWLKDGEYEGSARSDAGKWGEQARAQARVAEKRTARSSQTEQTPATTETLYHGSPDVSKIESLKPGNAGGYFGNGIYLARDPEVAQRFTKLESANPTLERNADGSFTDINTGKRVPGGQPGVLNVTLKDARLKQLTIEEMETEFEKFRKPNGVINLDEARNSVAEKYAKQGYDGFDVPASKNFNEPQVLIFPSSAKKLSVTDRGKSGTPEPKQTKNPQHEKLFSEALAGLGPEPKKTSGRTSINASGESSASQEAISRAASEKGQGIKRFRVDTRSGKEIPLFGPDAVDLKAGPYDKIIMRGPKGETVLDRGANVR
jgi:hypothetical protein